MNTTIEPKYKDDTALDVLRREHQIFLEADCGGNGTCGRCKVKFFDPACCPPPSEADRKLLTERELQDGFRLACTAVLAGRSEILIPDASLIPSEGSGKEETAPPSPSEIIAVDYGTTVVSGALVDLNQGVVSEASVLNRQKAYGADVVSRIRAANAGYGEELRRISADDLAALSAKLGRDPEKMRFVISANTVMGHLVSGFSCKGLGQYPYEPVDLSLRRDGNLTFLPGISGYVGADIVSGVCASNLDTAKEPWLYADIGTNGEMALGTGEDVLVTSAPAGPAFEGAGISCGMPLIKGAIRSVKLAGRNAVMDTVGDVEPVGLSGSGIIDLVSELLRNRYLDKDGTLAEEYAGDLPGDGFPVTGDVTVTEKDIREVQKAKAAIRAGMETLIRESGIGRKEIRKLVIAGSFGSGFDMENAAKIGLIPEDLLDVAMQAGNASLSGAVLYVLDTGFGARLEHFAEHAREVILNESGSFERDYILRMSF